DKMLLEAHLNAPPGSAARTLFEQRLASTEPAATFSLANSLAGFLTPWLLMTIAIGWLGHDRAAASANWRRLAGAAISALPLAACLVLTKSRAGYLATLVGFAALVLCSLCTRRHAWLVVGGSAVVASVLIAAGFAVGSLDRQVVSEAFKSLAYRWHYWQGALGIVAEHPWLGCGPGNFQDEYTRFKLPEASEVVADPHNFAFEIWATAGTPALLAFIAVLIAAAVDRRRAAKSAAELTLPDSHYPISVMAAAGGIVGFLLALAVGSFSTVGLPWLVFAAGCVVLPVGVVGFDGWIRRGSLPTYVPFVAALALLVNLLVAGGISFAGVAGTLWLLVAVGTNENRPRRRLPRSLLMGLCVANAALFIACYFSAYRPVLACRRLTALALSERSDARERLVAAAAADPLADEPWHLLAEGDFSSWLRDPSTESATWEKEQQEVLRRRPHSSAAWQEAGKRYLTAYHESQDDQRERFLSAALDHLRTAAELYPNSALVHAKLAVAFAAADGNKASEEAAIAMELHKKTPHEDQKLPHDLLNATQRLMKGRPSNAQD
ncbi:MAG: O-antigen ligase family protein, partial [Pirellulales bacterium]